MFLNCHSYFSLRYGTIPVKDLVQLGVANGVKVMALTDIHAVTGIYEFVKECKANGIKPIVGMEFRSGNNLLYVALALNNSGLHEINRFLTAHNLNGKPLPKGAPDFEDVIVIYPIRNAPPTTKRFEYIGVTPNDLQKLYRTEWKNRISEMVILQPVTFRENHQIGSQQEHDGIKAVGPTEFKLHQILRAIDNNTLISKLTKDDCCDPSEIMNSAEKLRAFYSEFPEIIANTEHVISRCHFNFKLETSRTRKCFSGSKAEDMEILTRLANEGMLRRYGADNEKAKERIVSELKVIDTLNFCAYFLITWDIVRYSNEMGLMHIGRGSGANSIVSYCIGITDICPLELDLYFERFLNLNRKSPPDFDIDWSWKDRDTILEYIFEKYKGHVAFTGTIAEFKYRSIFRELGKAFGLPKEELDALATLPVEQHEKNTVVQEIYKFGKLLEKYPNQRSMHSCGVLISEEPITNYSPLEMPPKGFPIVQFDMRIAEEIGLEKFDILSQRGLGHINDAVKLIEKNRGITVDIRNTSLSKDEAKANEFLGIGKTIGCFYIESPAMRGLLRRLKCDNYLTLVAASSIIRPGVAQSGMMKEYIFRHNHPDQFEYFHDVFREQLAETYGIMVYQEDVIKIALHFGGLHPADGDILRRAMSGKTRSIEELNKVRDRFLDSCRQQGHPEELSAEVYRQISSFAGYSFCKAHSASYAVESYQSLWLKVYYSVEFMVAVINNQGGFYRTEVYIHEARMSGANVLNPCVNKSEYETTLYGTDIYLGFMHLQGLSLALAQHIQQEREMYGDYTSLENFIRRISIGIESLQILIYIGAFRFTRLEKNELILRSRMILGNFKSEKRQPTLLGEPVKDFSLPQLYRAPFEDAFDEIELLGFTVSCSPFDLLQTKYRGSVMASDLVKFHKNTVKMLAYLISRKHVPTKRGPMYFGTWIDANGNYFDTAHFTDCLIKYPFKGGGCYLLLGTVEVDYHFPTITITKMAKLPFIADPRYSNDSGRQFLIHQQIREDVSMTNREPYPQEHEINLPRYKMNVN